VLFFLDFALFSDNLYNIRGQINIKSI